MTGTPRTRPWIRHLAALVLAVAAVGSSAGPAPAATGWHVDPAGDVLVNGDDDFGFPHEVRDVEYADITGVSTSYDAQTYRVSTSMRSYRSRSGVWQLKLRTSQGYDYRFSTDFVPEEGESESSLRRSSTATPGFFVVACDGLAVARTGRGITVRIPTSCLGGSWRVRTGVQAQQYPCFAFDTCEDDNQYDDDAFVDARRTKDTRLTLGPWLAQG